MRSVLVATALVALFGMVKPAASKDAYRWWYLEKGNTISLFDAEDVASDSGTMKLACVKKSGEIHVHFYVDGSGEGNYGPLFDALKANSDIQIDKNPSGKNDYRICDKVAWEEYGGWAFYFTMSDEYGSLDDLEKTGAFKVSIGKYQREIDTKKQGLSAVRRFRVACRPPPAPATTTQLPPDQNLVPH